MHTIQKWFERLAGVTEDEIERLHIASRVFRARPAFDLARLETPACWRRPRRF